MSLKDQHYVMIDSDIFVYVYCIDIDKEQHFTFLKQQTLRKYSLLILLSLVQATRHEKLLIQSSTLRDLLFSFLKVVF